jgi:hypothetical protein
MESIRNIKTKGPVFDSLQYAGNRLYNSVLATWRAELEPHTYQYLNAIKMSPIERIGDTMFVGVGNWKYLMQATSLDEDKIQYGPIESWRKSNWHCCEDKSKGIKPCMYDEHGKDIVKSIIDFVKENNCLGADLQDKKQ